MQVSERASLQTLLPSGSPYIESWYMRLNENARVGDNALTDIMWKCGQCQNKGAFLYYRYRYFTRCIDASYRHTSYRYIDLYRWIVTPLWQSVWSVSAYVYSRTRSLSNYTLFDNNLVQCLRYFSPEVMTDNTVFIIGETRVGDIS